MIADPTRVYDGWTSLSGGQDDGREPNLIDPTQAAELENIVCRGGSPETRPAIVELPATVSGAYSYDANGVFEVTGPPSGPVSETVFNEGLFQGVGYYAISGLQCLTAMIGGRMFKVVPKVAGCDVEEIPLMGMATSTSLIYPGTTSNAGRRNRNDIPIVYMVQADRYHITQDGESRAIIFDGIGARRTGTDEVPVGKIMAYGMGRLVVIRANREIVFGDIYNGKGKLGADVLEFTETNFLNEGGASGLPPVMGKPTAAGFYPQQDTSAGQGELIVYGEGGAESFFLSLPREQWKDSNFQRDTLLGIGCRGHRNLTSVNGDQWFHAQDGWRSYRQARAQINLWSQIPLSTPVRKWVEAETPWLQEFGSAIHFNNRLITTTTPIPNAGRLYHNGLLSLDFDVLSAFGKDFQPAWDGHFSGEFKVLQLVKGVFNGKERAFAFCLNEDNHNSLFEITANGIDDSSGPIPWRIAGRRGDYQTPGDLKQLLGGDAWVTNVVSNNGVPISADFRSDDRDEWTHWHDFVAIPQNGIAGKLDGGIPTAKPGQAPRKRLPTPPDVCDPETGRNVRLGYEQQVQLSGVGHCRIRKFRMHAKTKTDDSKGACE